MFDSMLSPAIRTVFFGHVPSLFVLGVDDCGWLVAHLFALLSSGEFDSTLGVFFAVFWLDSILSLSVYSLSFADCLFFLEVEAEVEELTVSLAVSRSFVLSKDVLISFFNELEAFFFDFTFLLVLVLFSVISIVVFDLISSRTIGVCLFSIASLSGFE